MGKIGDLDEKICRMGHSVHLYLKTMRNVNVIIPVKSNTFY